VALLACAAAAAGARVQGEAAYGASAVADALAAPLRQVAQNAGGSTAGPAVVTTCSSRNRPSAVGAAGPTSFWGAYLAANGAYGTGAAERASVQDNRVAWLRALNTQ